jgi:F-type H+-transporting ATPase subunit epsilon
MISLRIALPSKVVFEGNIRKVSVDAAYGSFTLLPRHIDFVMVLVPGILLFDTADEEPEEVFYAIDEGILIKQGRNIQISTRNAVRSDDLEHLHEAVESHFKVLDDQEKRARTALARMEADFVSRYLEIED